MGSGLEDEGTGGRETCGWIGGPMAIVEVVIGKYIRAWGNEGH